MSIVPRKRNTGSPFSAAVLRHSAMFDFADNMTKSKSPGWPCDSTRLADEGGTQKATQIPYRWDPPSDRANPLESSKQVVMLVLTVPRGERIEEASERDKGKNVRLVKGCRRWGCMHSACPLRYEWGALQENHWAKLSTSWVSLVEVKEKPSAL